MKAKFIYLLALLFVLNQKANAQAKETTAGDDYFEFGLFDDAIIKYEAALSKNPTTNLVYLHRQLAKCNLYSFRYTQADLYFSKVLQSDKVIDEDYLEYGIVQKVNGNYEKAAEMFRIYQARKTAEDPAARLQTKSIAWAIANADAVKPVTITLTDLDISGQALGYTKYDNGIIYAHARNKEKIGSMPLFDLDFAINKDTTHFNGSTDVVKNINIQTNEGAPSYSASAGLLYFNANEINLNSKSGSAKPKVGDEGISNFKIYVSALENGGFSKISELPFNNKNYNCIHPSISDNGEVLYFASDMPGGFGGLDIYMVKRNDKGIWGKPENLGELVNTRENEMFPFVQKNRIYFSSKGLLGYGGYDLYTASLNENGMPANVQNMGKPINSYRDDVALIAYEDGRLGYFSSNRGNNNGEDQVYFFHDHTLDIIPTPPPVVPIEVAKVDSNVTLPKIEASKPIEVVAAPEVKPVAPTKSAPIVKAKKSPAKVSTKVTKEIDAEVIDEPVAIENNESVLLNKIFPHVKFNLNDFTVGTDYNAILDTVIRAYKMSNKVIIQINGHADARGDAGYNMVLSKRRANDVKRKLIAKGVSSKRIITVGLGESQLLNNCVDGVTCSEVEHGKNRRVEIRLVK